MEKRIYCIPQVEVTYVRTVDLLRPTDQSSGGEMPTPPGGAPSRPDLF